ncbi:MAG: DUF1153 domain-containing protein [Rhodospirillales bacterium]|nr:DUF1153 domain-containing protein [Rhodospirillales bacterium]
MNELTPRTANDLRPWPDADPRSRRVPAITLADLPPPGTTRWVVNRKAAVVAGVKAGLLSLDEALERYGISLDEFMCWKRLLDDFGVKGLRVTRIKDYRATATTEDTRSDTGSVAPCAA